MPETGHAAFSGTCEGRMTFKEYVYAAVMEEQDMAQHFTIMLACRPVCARHYRP